MSKPVKPQPALMFAAILFSDEDMFIDVFAKLQKKYGPVFITSRKIKFVWSDYYEKEMGNDLNF